MQVFLYQGATHIDRIADPAGGTFDAAGDFDRLLPTCDAAYPILGRVGPHDDLDLDPATMPGLIAEIDRLLPAAHNDRERRGLQRLRTLADLCSRTNNGSLIIAGD
ncbi:hypothetical protein ACGFI9_34605 [Micromonospora sp. NPDC048930]|uniref:hypothetical protein n=1 Tax=Micromonospora sp. NPDC048930 TaxID=3364261 RepID=UPI00371EEC43